MLVRRGVTWQTLVVWKSLGHCQLRSIHPPVGLKGADYVHLAIGGLDASWTPAKAD
jgi:hypothetical protein